MISTADLQDWMKADDVDAPVLRRLEEAATQAIQKLTGHYYGVVATQTEIIRFRQWPLQLKSAPIGGVITSLSQWDGSAWSLVQASNYYVDGSFIWQNASYQWPPSYYLYPPQTLRFQAIYQGGYTVDALDADVWSAPTDIQMAVKLLVGHWFENRESVVVGQSSYEVPLSVQMLVAGHRMVSV